MTPLTANETAMLLAIAHDEMSAVNGNPKLAQTRQDLDTWSAVENWDGGAVKATKGKKALLSNLAQKNMIVCDGTGKEATVSFTDLGFETVMSLIAEPSAPAETAPAEAKPAKAKKQPAPIAKSPPKEKPAKSSEPRPFNPSATSKRGMAYAALLRPEGLTLAAAVEMLGWSRSVCSSELWEIGRLSRKKLTRDGETYRLA
ncbi:hypothetical protein [Rhizobium sp. BK251]|uniref:hypothetical protein n=1 Tax=Rhizobium sp. BK251 TaxID=2512125 RepID=UPI001044454D|nr:hypothetical protein [Rhizobium sp. BK251]TCL74444.1 hypothetical protein EV286_1024 [Rhizobium sp. BK251]